MKSDNRIGFLYGGRPRYLRTVYGIELEYEASPEEEGAGRPAPPPSPLGRDLAPSLSQLLQEVRTRPPTAPRRRLPVPNTVPVPDGWDLKEDGSLRNGIEAVSVPMPESVAAERLQHIYRWAAACGYGTTVRCGMHIHVNMGGRTPDALRDVLYTYALAEPYLFGVAGESREENIYCVPWYTDPVQYNAGRRTVRRMLAGEGPTSHIMQGFGANKYSALNLLPLSNLRTIEFRHLQTPATAEDAIRWLRLVSTVVESAPLVAGADDPEQVLVDAIRPYLTEHELSWAQRRAEEYDVRDIAETLSRPKPCTYKVADWGMPSALTKINAA